MAILVDTTLSGSGDVSGYNPAPLTLYCEVTVLGLASSHDPQPGGRYFDIGWVAPFFSINPTGTTFNYQFDPTFIQFEHFALSWHQFAGGLDGFHYSLGPGVTVRFLLTDD